MAVIQSLLNGVKIFIIADALFSWVLPPDGFPRSITKPILDPFYGPLRSLLSPLTGPVDLSPLIALGLVHALQLALRRE